LRTRYGRGCRGGLGASKRSGTRYGDGETRQRETETIRGALHQPALSKRDEGTANIGFFTTHTNNELLERGRRATTGETEEGAEDVDVEAHAGEPTFSTEHPSN
jgi:hypothetical protein